MAELNLIDLKKTYYKDKLPIEAVKEMNLSCNDGEFIAILGPSGCGKTTTLRMIAGLEDITSGTIKIGGEVVNDLHPSKRGIGLAFENYALYPPLNVYENIAFNLKSKGMNNADVDREVNKIAELLQIKDLLQMKVGGLSGGQKQRVNIARAIVRKPNVLLLDEPLSHLDGAMRIQMRTEIKRLQSEIGATTIIVTHDQSEALALADRIAVMNKGILQQYDTPNMIFNKPNNEFVAGFIGEPAMNIFTVNTIERNGTLRFQIDNTDVDFPVPKDTLKYIENNKSYRFGIRPTDIDIVYDDQDYTLKSEVVTFENLGEERHIQIRIHDSSLIIVTSEDVRFEREENISLRFNENKINLFDIETGYRIND